MCDWCSYYTSRHCYCSYLTYTGETDSHLHYFPLSRFSQFSLDRQVLISQSESIILSPICANLKVI